MTEITRQKIFEKIDNLKEYFNYLLQLREEIKNKEEFLADFRLYGNVERYLQLSIQTIIDIIHLIIVDLELKRPQDNYEAVSVLCEKKIIPENLAGKISKMIGIRNILVHEYGKIDRGKIYEILQENITDIEEFQKIILLYIKQSNS